MVSFVRKNHGTQETGNVRPCFGTGVCDRRVGSYLRMARERNEDVESPGGEEKRIRAKLVRILKKQPDGSWKGALGMWNTSE